jgi:hypothetical protein
MTTTDLATISNDGWDAVPAQTGSAIRGKLVKFVDRVYIINGTTEPLSSKTPLVVTGVTTAWVKFEDGKPICRITQPRQRHPDRDELGDLNQDEWPEAFDGKSADPWQDTRYLYLIDPGSRRNTHSPPTASAAGAQLAICGIKFRSSAARTPRQTRSFVSNGR